MPWDICCKVVDNQGDVGVCWRLALGLAARGVPVRLWIDDANALRWMAPAGAPGVSVGPWSAAAAVDAPGSVVVETFGGGLPEAFMRRIAQQAPAPLWINLEHLSAEAFVERSHRLPSPQLHDVAAGLTKWFFYPGFGERTGGLLREADLMERRQHFDATAWLAANGIRRAAGERLVSIFCYDNPALPALLDALAPRPTLLLACAGHASRPLVEILPQRRRAALRVQPLPWLSQIDYDHLLWSCDLNFVRGEDSFVRAQWAGAPFVWQAYPQADGAHWAKLQAFVDRFVDGAATPQSLRRVFAAWNGLSEPVFDIPPLAAWREQCTLWRARLLEQTDLVEQLLSFAAAKR